MLLKYWDKLSQIGVDQTAGEKQMKRVVLTNQFSAVALTIFFFSGINNLIIGDLFSGLLLEGFMLTCIAGLLINRNGYHAFAVSFLFFATNVSVFYFNSYSGMMSGTHLYYFPLILAIAFLFDFKTEKKVIILHLSLILALILLNLITDFRLFKSRFIDDDDRYQMFICNLIFSCVAVGFFMFLTIRNGIRETELYHQRIAERELAEKKMKEALAEKEVLLSELHHRVKNNLAIISGLFSLKIDTDPPSEARNVLIESRNRVLSMSLIHNRLYNNHKLTDVNFEQYTKELISEINASYPSISGSVNVHTDIGDVVLNINVAVPCGLILNELLTNCYKHAFTHSENGVIRVSFKSEEGQFVLRVSDNGSGLADGYQKKESLGMTVIDALCDQLSGTYAYSYDNGTSFWLKFPAQ